MRSRTVSCVGVPHISRTVVTPLATRSFNDSGRFCSGHPSLQRCPCMSPIPGIRYLPAPSTRVAPAGTWTFAAGPTATIRPPSTTTVWSFTTRGLSPGTTATPTKTVASTVATSAFSLPDDGGAGCAAALDATTITPIARLLFMRDLRSETRIPQSEWSICRSSGPGASGSRPRLPPGCRSLRRPGLASRPIGGKRSRRPGHRG